MKVAVTGATGFTGRRVVRALLGRGCAVTALVRPPATARDLPPEVTTVEGDMGDATALARLLGGADAFMHVASLGFGHADQVVTALEEAGVPRSVFFSSTALFTRLPAASKAIRLAAEERVRSMRKGFTILRPTMIYGGAGDRNISRLVRFVDRSPVVPLPGGGRALVQPVHVEDLGRAAVDALFCEAAAGREYNLPGAQPAPLRDLVAHVGALLGRRPLLLPVPLRPAAALAGLWHGLGLPPRVSAEQILRLGEDKVFPYDDARRDWGYAPRGIIEGLTDEVQRLREAGWI
jgi:uncharacterized protein YbjT (DUF2867 family)